MIGGIQRSFSITSTVTRHEIPTISSESNHLNPTVFSRLLQECIKCVSIPRTRRVHCRILMVPQFTTETFIHNRLIEAYSKAGSVDDAGKVFAGISFKNVFSWNAILAAYTRFGFIDRAIEVFEEIPMRDQCSWNSIISGCAQAGLFRQAVEFFVRMTSSEIKIGTHAFASVLSACTGIMDADLGVQIHAKVTKTPLSSDVFLGSALLDMYSKCRRPTEAQVIFDKMPFKNVVTWNTLITCYEQNGPVIKALELFFKMTTTTHENVVIPDELTLASVVSACAGLSAEREGRQIHTRVVKSDKLREDLILSNALVDMYSKCGRIIEARRLFDRMSVKTMIAETSMITGYAKAASVDVARSVFAMMPERNVVAWNALIAGYTQNDNHEEALNLYRSLKRESIFPTDYTFGNILSACGNLTVLDVGLQIHNHVVKHGFRLDLESELYSDVFVGNSLLDMYLKCGNMGDGKKVFSKMTVKDRVTWNAMIVGHAQNGAGEEALLLFDQMLIVGETPDHVTMIGVLTGCSHAGLVNEGLFYFKSMAQTHNIPPSLDHYTCMVDLLGRAGRFDEITVLIADISTEPDAVLWGSLLAACKLHRNIEMGEFAAEKLLELTQENSGTYVLLSNMYAEKGRWEDVRRVRRIMKSRGVVKKPGCSWIEIERKVHVFLVKDGTKMRKNDIYETLRCICLQMKQTIGEDDTNDYIQFIHQSNY